jgi:methylenetetrahydrofolate dehydrogenase (NADP+)/methenyltetrahydrofolate cyclohydrolase
VPGSFACGVGALTARILDGRAIAASIWAEVEVAAADLAARGGPIPHLAIFRIGDAPASVWYERQITRAFGRRGLGTSTVNLPSSTSESNAAARLRALAADPAVHAILLQLPLPAPLQSTPLIELLPRDKDLEGLHPYHAGRLALGRPTFIPSTPLAGLELLRRSAIELPGRLAVVVGRSPIVGRPLASLLIQSDCTVVVCHSRTRDLPGVVRQADLLLAATGHPNLIHGDMLKPGAVVLDFGTIEVEGRLVGDVDYDSAVQVASAITPVPGGVGPVTTAVLARNLVRAVEAMAENRSTRRP